tara:strand:- start:269 stop:436 length:168 start_codon:yes stop_codon:yes gene_type:complete
MISIQLLETVYQINWNVPIAGHQQVTAIDLRGATTALIRQQERGQVLGSGKPGAN